MTKATSGKGFKVAGHVVLARCLCLPFPSSFRLPSLSHASYLTWPVSKGTGAASSAPYRGIPCTICEWIKSAELVCSSQETRQDSSGNVTAFLI